MFFCNGMQMAGILFSLNDTSKGIIDSTIIGRVKSPESIAKKEKRAGRKGKNTGDIIGYNIIFDRVHNSSEFFDVFGTEEIKKLYNERNSNISLMKEVIDFVNKLRVFDLSSELDETLTEEETKESSKRRLYNMQQNCKAIFENVEKYYMEDPSSSEIELQEDTEILAMCRELLRREIKRAIDSMREQKKQLETDIENQSSPELLSIQELNLRVINERLNMLDSQKDWNYNQFIELLTGEINKNDARMYLDIMHKIKSQENEFKDKEESNEEKYCRLFMLILYRLTKLEFVKKGAYEGLIYNNLFANLQNQLKEYKNSELDGGSYCNVTFESMQKLVTNLIRLNARLSDKLQFIIAKYEMKYYLRNIVKQFSGVELVGDEKIKPNGYVSTHYDADTFEIKMTTHYRDRVSSKGSAAYGSGRIDNKKEKSREMLRLKHENYKFRVAKFEDIPAIQKARINNEYGEKLLKYCDMKKNDIENIRLEMWKGNLLNSTPRYFSANCDGKKVTLTFFGSLQNVERYYSETSVISINNKVHRIIEEIKEDEKERTKKLFFNEPYIIEISREMYAEFVNNELEDMKKRVELGLQKVAEKDSKVKAKEK